MFPQKSKKPKVKLTYIKEGLTDQINIWQVKDNDYHDSTTHDKSNSKEIKLANLAWFTPKTQPETHSMSHYSSHHNSDDEYWIDDRQMWPLPEGFYSDWNKNEYLFS